MRGSHPGDRRWTPGRPPGIGDPDLVIFDMDGVLVDTSPCHRRAFAELWDRLGIDGPAYAEIAGRRTVDVVCEQMEKAERGSASGREASLRHWVKLKQRRAREIMADEALVYDDVPAALEGLSRPGRVLALGTGASRASTEIVLRRLGMARRLAHVVTAEDVSRGKPAPDTFLLAMERAGITAGRTLIVEDSAAGVAAGVASGAWVVSVRTGEKVDDPRFVGAFPGLRQVVEMLETGR